jgi:hypothetical protein
MYMYIIKNYNLKILIFLIKIIKDHSNSLKIIFPVSTWMIWKFWTRYNMEPIRSVVETFYAPIHMIPFPAVTFCPLISPFPSRRKEALKHLRLPYNMTNETADFLLKYVQL